MGSISKNCSAQSGCGHAATTINFTNDSTVIFMMMVIDLVGLVLLMVIGGELGRHAGTGKTTTTGSKS